MDYYILNNGYKVPQFSFGMSFIKDRQNYEGYCKIINSAIDGGFRWFDSARDYGNEAIVGKAIKAVCAAKGIQRNEIFITTKVGNSQQAKGNLKKEIEMSLNNLKTDYIDVWMLHWPYSEFYIDSWQQMIDIYKEGKVRAIGICNMNAYYLNRLIAAEVELLPMVIQNEIHPFNNDADFIASCIEHKILFEAHTSCGSMIDKVMENRILIKLGLKHNKTISQIILRWHYQKGRVAITRSKNLQRCLTLLDIFDFSLSVDEINSIDLLNENYCVIPKSLCCIGY